MSNIFTQLNFREGRFLPYLNTDSILDVATGAFVPGEDGEAILNGGVAPTNGVGGRPNTFKSTEADSFMLNAMARYAGSHAYVYDSEFSKQLARMLKMPDLPVPDLEDRLHITDPTAYDLEEFYHFIRDLAEAKIKAAKDMMVECPMIDPNTGKRRLMMVPTFVSFDSFSKAEAKAVTDMLDDNDPSSSETNMYFMRSGRVKKMITSQLPLLAARAGLYLFFMVHIGDKFELNPRIPSAKDLQHMRASDKVKSAGSDFLFLMNNFLETRHAAALISDDKKSPLYPDVGSGTSDLNEVTTVMVRAKNNASGVQIKPLMSQALGLQSALTSYHFLKEYKYFGLGGNPINHFPLIYPTCKIARTVIREKIATDPKLGRALQILFQICFIRHNWSLRDMPVPFDMPIEQIAEKLMNGQGYSIDDILTSRGYWTYNDKELPPYLSTYDILAIISDQYRPKWFKAGAPIAPVAPLKMAA